MRIPQRPPDHGRVIDRLGAERLTQVWSQLLPATSGDYRPWDEMRNRPVPAGLTHEEWWAVIKLGRAGMQRELPLVDAAGRPFTYALPDQVLRSIDAVNRDAGGRIGASDQVTNPATR